MMLRKYIPFLILIGLVPVAALGQIAEAPKGIIYNYETAYNLKVSTSKGLSFGIEKGRLRTYDRTTFYHLSLGTLNSPREVKQSPPPQTRFRSYVFGKQNSVTFKSFLKATI